MLVDPAILRTFAGQVEGASQTITGADLAGKVKTAFDGLPGSEAQWAASLAGDWLRQPLDQFAGQVSAMGDAVRGAAGTYEVMDEDLAATFEGLMVDDPSSGGSLYGPLGDNIEIIGEPER
ncbi:Uncharacterised protein [Nocardia otitidiscaviarum]|uniref:WXG100 family type VII secretion target n=1 Tax=Nocardia otitidiscaviarum TaxID=1823 RepID=A0A379JG53_9NOCA|nr:type VII secretion target [Nocardia otitidiscaviarum]MBF6177295.1 hypothetical protein [Nocardia otitidiscaviarum]SUD47435.1 Uncharacterised protein [Nocardia otitidiscaviarum]